MGWTLTDDIAAYQRAVAPLLEADPVRNTVLLSVLASLASYGSTAFGSEPPVLAWWSPDGDRVQDGQPAPGAAALQTPPYPLLVTALPGQAGAELAQLLADLGTAVPGINGAEQDVTALARAWLLVTGRDGQISQRQRLYRLRELVPPDPAPDGAARVAAATDTAIAR